ncbi:MAG: pyrimidine-nucleoside phosphorylase [Lachnospiraceae bacterium]|nr:pyrimidine-nucleoside phosphorylase [Lachnospiraceae bacterium]
MRMYDIIAKKRDGFELSTEEINFFVGGCTTEEIPDYQISALLMAIYLNGMTDREIYDLTLAMAKSGQQADLGGIDGVTVDKHSTGGVGDKTTLIVAPLAAALGVRVAKMSGRGLGHTGGTVDKLESIDGFKTTLSPDEFVRCVNDVGVCVIGQSGNLAPADKKLYALRDVTATVSSIPLIASSIMSKKIASGNSCILLDVKTGSGAFMKTPDEAYVLAEQMVKIGAAAGRKTAALVTNMNIPLGYAVGNSLEVIEALRILKGEQTDELYHLCVELAANMLRLASEKPIEECRVLAANAISDGSALRKFEEMTAAQGGDVRLLKNTRLFKRASGVHSVRSKKSGFICHMDSEKIGMSAVILGAGRTKKGDSVDHSAGIVLRKKTGDYTEQGEEIAVLYTNNPSSTLQAESVYLDALTYSNDKPDKPPLIISSIMG